MENKYQIGNHQFETEDEYKKALKDLQYVENFMKELDINKPKIAKELYHKLQKTNSILTTKVGDAFKNRLVQTFVRSEVQQKKEELMQIPKTVHAKSWIDYVVDKLHRIRDAKREAMKEHVFAIFMRLYQCGILGTLLYVVLTTLLRLEKPMIENETLCRVTLAAWSLFSYYWGYVILLMILISLAQMVWYFVTSIQRESKDPGKCYLLLMVGVSLIICFTFTAVYRGRLIETVRSLEALLQAIRQNRDYLDIYRNIQKIIVG